MNSLAHLRRGFDRDPTIEVLGGVLIRGPH